MSIRVGLIGFGKTGKEVAKAIYEDNQSELIWIKVSQERTPEQVIPELASAGITEGNIPSFLASEEDFESAVLNRNVDVIIDFSVEENLEQVLGVAIRHKIPYVSAVSHYSTESRLKLNKASERIPVIWAPNITVGINFLFLASKAFKIANPQVDIQISEEHFREKAGVSGTALRLADMLGEPSESINSVRAGGIVGIHEVLFGSQNETIRLRHESISRRAFGNGALFAARHLLQRKAGMYTMEEFILPYFSTPLTQTGHIPILSGAVAKPSFFSRIQFWKKSQP